MKRILLVCLIFLPVMAYAGDRVSTAVTVRALAHDAKLIPGVAVEIAESESGRVLASGRTEGGTGDTARIMTEPREHGEAVYATEGAAAFTAELALARPTLVTISAVQPETKAAASRTMWLTPGHDLEGNGVVLELYGLRVDIEAPGAASAGDAVAVTAEVRMLCGCPVTPGGLWDANGFTVSAALLRDGEVVTSGKLDYAGQTSMFSGRLEAPEAGDYRLQVTAEQPGMSNFGVAATALSVGE